MSDDVVEMPLVLDEQGQPRITAERPESLPRRIVEGPVLTEIAAYIPVPWDGANTSGIKPMGDAILILPDQPQAKTSGGIYLSDNEVERRAYSAETGVIVAVGDGAWAWNADRTRKYEGERPSPGTRVYFERYSGQLPHGIDGLIYRLMTDKQIGGIEIGLPETHEFAMVDGKRIVRRKESADVPRAPAAAADGETLDDGPEAAATTSAMQFPRYAKIDGNMLIAFSTADMRDKGPDAMWWATQAAAENAAVIAAHKAGS